MRVVALAGGTGSAKLLRGLSRAGIDLTVVANVGDNIWMYGIYVCPDVDIACYSLAGVADPEKGWGIEGDTFRVLAALSRLGVKTWFALGDQDLGTCLARTEMIRSGNSLTEATDWERRALGVKSPVLPLTDDPVETRIRTQQGDSHLQEFWVRDRGEPQALGVEYRGAPKARISRQVREAIEDAKYVVVCPANPVTSIGPMLAVPGFRKLVAESGARKVGLSPMEGRAPFSGPAGKLMKATGIRPDSAGVAETYQDFLDSLLISSRDAALKPAVEAVGVDCRLTDTHLDTPNDQVRLARELLRA
jgi:LPPG:FO 2-phospho-L-lactate transferase